jgi:LacI family transcriptional regulator
MTIKDLAAQTGYSVGTVSRVLNNQPHVSELARKIVLKAAAESGFQLNENARQLKQQQSNSLLVVCKGNYNELFDALLMAIQSRVVDTQYTLIIDHIDERANEVRRALQLCREKKPQGILFLGGNQEHFQESFHQINIPCVLVTSSAADLSFANLSSVTSDDTLAAAMAIEELLDMGHKKVVVIGGHRDYSEITRLRHQGCVQAFRGKGIQFQESQYETARFTFEGGYQAAQALLEREPDFTALFAMSDVMALGAIRGLADAGKRVPEDISVVGFDGLQIGEYTLPRLSTVSQSVEQLAQRSMCLLLSSIEKGAEACHEVVPVSLQLRESVRKL